jgi:hypothetical protein
MKSVLFLCLLSGLLLSAFYGMAQEEKKVKIKDDKTKAKGAEKMNIPSGNMGGDMNMRGAYAMLRQSVNMGSGDSLMGNEQLKIFTDKYMMYAHAITGDSLADYGIGTYRMENGKVKEYVFYTANGGAHKDTFELAINKTADGYTQVINFPPDSQGRAFVLTEDYKNVSQNMTSPLDGAWKQTKVTFTPKGGSPQTNNNPTQFKLYEAGHFIWASSSKDSATGKPVSFFGYGTFKMNGNNQITEVNSQSSFVSQLVGRPVTLKLQFPSKDSYIQAITWENGDKLVEEYERLK